MTLLVHVFLNLRTPKDVVRKMLRSRNSDHPLKSNMVNWPKHCSKLNDSNFTIFIDPWEGNWGWKSFSAWSLESQDCLLTYWPPVISILFLIETIFSNILKCSYLRNEKYFLIFFCLYFLDLDSRLDILKKKDDLHS